MAAYRRRGYDEGDEHEGGERQRGALKPEQRQQEAAEEEADALEGVLRAGEDRDPAVERRLVALGYDELDSAFGAHLVEILGDARQGLGDHHVWDHQQRGRGEAEHAERRDLDRQPHEEGDLQAQAGREPAADQIRDDPGDLVEDE